MKKLVLPGMLAALLLATPGAQASCHAALKARLPQSGTIIFGEMHGTREIPAFFSACVRDFIDHGEQVRVFLEFDASDTEHTAKYLRGEIDEAALLSSPRWLRHDGRTSQAILELHRALKGVDVVGFAAEFNGAGGDAGMAENFLKHRVADGYNLVLVGNSHARLIPSKSDGVQPYGQYVKAKLKDVISLDARYTGGEAWACAPYCEAIPMSGNEPGGTTPAKRIRFTGKGRAFNGYFSVGAISASPPAVEK